MKTVSSTKQRAFLAVTKCRLIIPGVLVLLSFDLDTTATVARAAALDTPPPLPGSYKPAIQEHPFIFTTQKRMRRLLTAHTTTTHAALARLEAITSRIVANPDKYSSTYSGCSIDQYNKTFAAGGDSAVVVISWLATYAYLTSLNEGYGKPALQAQAVAEAKSIMLNWVRTGFRINGKLANDPGKFCSDLPASNRIASALVSLLVGRSMPYWVHTEDLLTALGAFTPKETAELHGFLDGMDSLLRKATQVKATHDENMDCGKYDNQTIQNLLGLMAIARFRGDAASFSAAARGSSDITVPWTLQVQGSIYGRGDHMRSCYDATSTSRHYYFQIPSVAPGEIIDRYRAVTYQPFGYTLGALENLLLSARLLQDSGFSAVNYQGSLGQSPKSALDYYSYFFTRYLDTSASILPNNSDPYPSYSQYVGHPVSRDGGATVDGRDDLLAPFILGYELYLDDSKIKGVLEKSLSFASPRIAPLSAVDALTMDDLPLLGELKPSRTPPGN